jgi:hypothetical protein
MLSTLCSKMYDSEVLMGQLRANGKEVNMRFEAEEGNIIALYMWFY